MELHGTAGVEVLLDELKFIGNGSESNEPTPLHKRIEATRMMAQRMFNEGGTRPEDRIALGLRLAAGRQPDEGETQVLLGNLRSQLEYFHGHPQEATRLLAVGTKPSEPKLNPEELAAYAVIASLILNLDEVITKQ